MENDFLREEPPTPGGSARPSPILNYLRLIEVARAQGNDTEHTHRPALKALLESLDSRVTATNEPKRIQCGAPDLVITRKKTGLVIGHVEAKDIGVSLSEAKKSEQLKRYLPALSNLLLTDYQVCEKWLKDRRGRKLGADEIEHYQRTVTALAETRTLMAQIDSLIADHGGWPIK